MAARAEPAITVEQVRELLQAAREERDTMITLGLAVTFLAGALGSAVYFVATEIAHTRYQGRYRRVSAEIERRRDAEGHPG